MKSLFFLRIENTLKHWCKSWQNGKIFRMELKGVIKPRWRIILFGKTAIYLQEIVTNAFTKSDAAKIHFSVRATKETRLMAVITVDFVKHSDLEKIRFENSHLMGVFERDFHNKRLLL